MLLALLEADLIIANLVFSGYPFQLLMRSIQMPQSTSYAVILPFYSAESFVNREKEIKLVKGKAETLAREKRLDGRTLIFMGQRGAGKTWLMLHLQSIIAGISGILSTLLDLKNYAGDKPEIAIGKILNNLSQELFKQPAAKSLDLSELSREFMRSFRTASRPLVLLVDTVFESDWQLLAMLENYLLGPLAIERNVFIVMAGRGHAYPWKTPELRLRAEFVDLEAFDPDHTKSQLERQTPASASQYKKIFALSQGNPLANHLLAAHPEAPAIALDQTIDELLQVVPEEEQETLRAYLEALSVLSAFDEEQIPTMLAAYYGNPDYQQWKPSQARQVREKVVKYSFAHWDEEKKGYVVESTLLNLLKNYLMMQSQQYKWQSLNCAAYSLYKNWIKKYPRTSSRWQTEAERHLAQLAELELSVEDCVDTEN